MDTKEIRIAIPTNAPGGADSTVSEHFGHCDGFTVLTLKGGTISDEALVALPEHGQGGCMIPVQALVEAGADAVVVGGIGQRPLMGFQQFKVPVFHASGIRAVRDVAEAFYAEKLALLEPSQACGGGHEH